MTRPRSASLGVHLPWVGLLLVLTLIPFGSSLLDPTRVLSERTTDVTLHFLFSRAFGFGEMATGNFPLWNPYIYGGIPYLGQFQSALLYPPNLIFLVLPLALAINLSFTLHVFLLGAFTYAWAALRGLLRPAAFLSGAAAMFSGAVLLHIYAGHLSNMCSLAWIPLIFAGIDQWLARRHAGWLILAAAAAALQIYAGHPQYVYFTALIAGLYALVFLPGSSKWWAAAAGLAAIYPLAALLAAAQLLPGITATTEAVRSGGVAYEFSSMFSFPPENLLTVVAPWIFGDMRTVPYWGRCYLWEMSLFAGAGVLVLAAFGGAQTRPRAGSVRLLLLLAAAILLALGAHTPLHKLLFHILPGFSSFRGSSKFILFAGLFLALLAGMGADRLLRGDRFPSWLAALAGVLGAALVVVSFLLGPEFLGSALDAVSRSGENYLLPSAAAQPDFRRAALEMATHGLRVAGALFLMYAGLFVATRRLRWVAWVAGGAALIELVIFARHTVVSFPLADFTYRPVAEFLSKNPGDFRTLNLFNADASMLLRSENIWGYDPGVLKRYSQLLHVSQGLDPAAAGQYLAFRGNHPLLALLRTRFILAPNAAGQIDITSLLDPFPRFFLVAKYRVLPDSTAVLNALRSPWFDLREEILLESEPDPVPEKERSRHRIAVKDFSTDHWTLDVETDRAAILVMTDAYSRDWRVEALPDSVQTHYRMQPADHALRAIPLAAGRHHLRLEYVPSGFRIGVAVSLLAMAGCTGILAWPRGRRILDRSGH